MLLHLITLFNAPSLNRFRLLSPLIKGLILFTLIAAGHTFANSTFTQTPSQVFSSLNTPSSTTFLPVEQAYQLTPSIQNNQIILNWTIAEGYYLYKKNMAAEGTSNNNTTPLPLVLAKGTEKHDEFFGDTEVYYQATQATITTLPDADTFLLTMTSQGCADAGLCYPPHKQYFTVDLINQSITETTALAINSSSGNTTTHTPSTSLTTWFWMLSSAFIGGLILNLMPCVFPVLSLKVLSFMRDTTHHHAAHGISYSAGVIASFAVIALILLTLRETGAALGWGFQLQSPWFIALLMYLFFSMALNLSGAFEFSSLNINRLNSLSTRQSYRGSFATGLLATLVASPCTAPFMGAALGFAITQPTLYAIWIFIFLGLGMATPVLLLSLCPPLLKHLPKPGAWMQTFKQLLAFPLYATVLWLGWVISHQAGTNALFTILIGCLLIGLAIVLWAPHTLRKLLAIIALVTAASLPFSPFVTEPPTQPSTSKPRDTLTIWSNETLETLRKNGQAVFVNVTADWCITCLANENLVLNTDAVNTAFQQEGIVYLKADWTRYDAGITAYLEKFGRNGVPLYVFYPPNNQPPIVLPQLLTTERLINTLKNHQLTDDSSRSQQNPSQ